MKVAFINLLLVIFIVTGMQTYLFAQSLSSGIKDLSEGADLILTGKVIEQKAQWNSDKSSISTVVTLQVDESLKGGDIGNMVVITHPGGEIGSIGEYYSHIPSFENNEQVLVFLKKYTKDKSYRVYEGESGKISLSADPVTGERVTPQRRKLTELRKEIIQYLHRQ